MFTAVHHFNSIDYCGVINILLPVSLLWRTRQLKMATASINSPVYGGAQTTAEELTIKDAMNVLSREERFMGTVHAMNTLLIHKGVYSQKEFDAIFCRWAKTQLKRAKRDRPGHKSILARLFR